MKWFFQGNWPGPGILVLFISCYVVSLQYSLTRHDHSQTRDSWHHEHTSTWFFSSKQTQPENWFQGKTVPHRNSLLIIER